MVQKITKGIKISGQKDFEGTFYKNKNTHYAFKYKVTIENRSKDSVQLNSRHWVILDSLNQEQELDGQGVIGKKPTIEPNTFFEYTSFCPLRTPMGFMEGSYRMLNKDGEEFDLKINKFRLLASQFLN